MRGGFTPWGVGLKFRFCSLVSLLRGTKVTGPSARHELAEASSLSVIYEVKLSSESMAQFTQRVLRPTDAGVYGTLFVPVDREPKAAVLLIGGSGGSEPSYIAEALAENEIAALSLAYFGRPGLPAQLRNIPLEYFRDALHLLREVLPSQDVPIMIIGISRGSEAALLSGVLFDDLVQGVVVSVPSNLVVCSWPPGGPAWLSNGSPLSYVSHFGPHTEHAEAVIPVERIRGPILLISAGADQVWPSAAMARAISKRLDSHGHTWGHRVLEYPDATHSLGYLIPNLPESLPPPVLFDWPSDRAARSDAWPQVIDFIGHSPPDLPGVH
jgi:dienelactone hydrolase